jgi:hypothetical protein
MGLAVQGAGGELGEAAGGDGLIIGRSESKRPHDERRVVAATEVADEGSGEHFAIWTDAFDHDPVVELVSRPHTASAARVPTVYARRRCRSARYARPRVSSTVASKHHVSHSRRPQQIGFVKSF